MGVDEGGLQVIIKIFVEETCISYHRTCFVYFWVQRSYDESFASVVSFRVLGKNHQDTLHYTLVYNVQVKHCSIKCLHTAFEFLRAFLLST